jgi:hypothetical protein
MKKEAMLSKPPQKKQPLSRASTMSIGCRLLGVKSLAAQGGPTESRFNPNRPGRRRVVRDSALPEPWSQDGTDRRRDRQRYGDQAPLYALAPHHRDGDHRGVTDRPKFPPSSQP